MDGGVFAVGQCTYKAAVLADSVLELKANLSVWGLGASSGMEPQSHDTQSVHPEDGCCSVANVATA